MLQDFRDFKFSIYIASNAIDCSVVTFLEFIEKKLVSFYYLPLSYSIILTYLLGENKWIYSKKHSLSA